VCYLPHVERTDFVAELARRWLLLARKANADKRVALILANYPTRDGRIGNGVGLDTPAGALNILRALESRGYPVAGLPESGTAL
ncbi:cobaltochelatase subunit CobN, partial [Klebsiella pneumoniae]|nr:cobaltochelatase subunit CobN [Klebsiella pneumoniae]